MTDQPTEWADFSAKDIDDEIQHQLGALAELGEQRAWGVAKLTEVIDRQAKGAGRVIQRKALYAAVAQHARSSGESVRMWHSVYLKVPETIRVEFGDRLSFHQMKAVCPHAKTESEFADVINRWLDYAANSGHSPGSVDGLRAWLGDQKGAPPPEVGRHQRIGKAVKYMIEDEHVPEPMRTLYRKFYNAVISRSMATDNPAQWSWDELPPDAEEV